jgi:beta-1,2-mannosidase
MFLLRTSLAVAAFAAAASTWFIGPFSRPEAATPVIAPQNTSVFHDPILKKNVSWEALHTFNPAAVVRKGKVCVLYRAEDNSGEMQIGMHTSRLGLAQSGDGLHFERQATPVFFPADDAQRSREWPGGVEDPRVVESPEGLYVLTYTQWNRKTYTVGIATSPDLVHWTKYGPAFGSEGKYAGLQYKSAAILTECKDDRLVATRLNGSYWMWWGEITVRLAKSDDLIHWHPVEDEKGQPLSVLGKRQGRFDSAFPEVGPPPVLTKNGIVVIYNGKNAEGAQKANGIGAGAYSVGEALFSGADPTKLLHRTDTPVLQPEMPFEKTGQYAAGTTFAEGLVFFKGKWFLYYGTADSFVGVVTAKALR